MNLKNEGKFILKRYCSNGFTIWALVLLITFLLNSESIISQFRTSLWLYNVIWVFFVPIILQAFFEIYHKIKLLVRFPVISKTQILYTVALSGLGWVLIIDVAFFVGGALLIIGEYNNGQGIADENKYNFMNYLSYIAGLFILPFSSIFVVRSKEYLIKNGVIEAISSKRLTKERKVSITCLAFSFSWTVFAIYYFFQGLGKV